MLLPQFGATHVVNEALQQGRQGEGGPGSCLSVSHGLLTSYIPPMHKHPSQHILQVKGRLLGKLSTISVIHVIGITPINATRLRCNCLSP